MTLNSVEIITLFDNKPTPMRRARRSDALANERLILSTASRLFSEKTVDSVSMSAIAAAAGIGKGTLYRAFANKGELCLALMDDDLRMFQDETIALLNEQTLKMPLETLVEFLRHMVMFMGKHAALMCEAESSGALQGHTEINQTSLHEWFRLTVLLLLQKADETGDIAKSADLDYLADAVLAPLNPSLIRHQLEEQRLTIDVLSDQLVHFIMHGVGG